jgi:hypothetical protein
VSYSQDFYFVIADKLGEDFPLGPSNLEPQTVYTSSSKMRPFCLCSEARHLISAARNKKT